MKETQFYKLEIGGREKGWSGEVPICGTVEGKGLVSGGRFHSRGGGGNCSYLCYRKRKNHVTGVQWCNAGNDG